jgi:hypothetical protein
MFNAGGAWEIGIAIIFAILGALARLLTNKEGERPQRSLLISELFIAGFMGGMMILLTRASGLEGDWVGLICGVSGWIGPKVMDHLVKPAEKALSALNPIKGITDVVDNMRDKKDD